MRLMYSALKHCVTMPNFFVMVLDEAVLVHQGDSSMTLLIAHVQLFLSRQLNEIANKDKAF